MSLLIVADNPNARKQAQTCQEKYKSGAIVCELVQKKRLKLINRLVIYMYESKQFTNGLK